MLISYSICIETSNGDTIMQRAIKNLIRDRGLHRYVWQVVKVESRPSRPIGLCGDNSVDEVDANRLDPNKPSPVKSVSGWIVGEWDGERAPFTPHFWNYDTRTDTFYDTTEPGYFKNNPNVTYVVDDQVGELDWDEDCFVGFIYKKDNRPYVVKKDKTIRIDSFTNTHLEQIYFPA